MCIYITNIVKEKEANANNLRRAGICKKLERRYQKGAGWRKKRAKKKSKINHKKLEKNETINHFIYPLNIMVGIRKRLMSS